ncbi:MAG: Flp pilus assembly protein CpaB [Phototrophicaceae bacterium]
MQGRTRILILILLIVIIGAVAAVLLLGNGDNDGDSPSGAVFESGDGDAPAATEAPAETPLPTQELVDIIVSVQNISRGSLIPPDAVRFQPWPLDAVPFNVVTSMDDVVGKRARTDIYVEQPVLTSYVVDDLASLAAVGSDASAIIPSGLVGIAMPIDVYTSVAYAIQPGDRVDIIISMLFIELDEAFQSAQPNSINLVNTNIDEGGVSLTTGADVEGRFETLRVPLSALDPNTLTTRSVPVDWPVLVRPSEEPRPRLVTQRTVQDSLVLYVGEWPSDGRLFGPVATPTPVEEVAPPPAQQQQGGDAPPQPTDVPDRPDIVTLAVTPQEAVILNWIMEAGIPFVFTLRAASDTSRVPTDPVTLDYIMNDYNITVPVKRAFSIEPAIRSIRQIMRETETTQQP